MPKLDLPDEFKSLHFDRFDVHYKGKKIAKDIELAIKVIHSRETKPELKKLLCKQVGIYYAFCVREAKYSSQYLEQFMTHTQEGTLEYAEACNLLGFAKAIDGGYKDERFFLTALDIYESLLAGRESHPDSLLARQEINAGNLQEINLAKAFAKRYLAVAIRRQAIQADRDGNVSAAATIFQAVVRTITEVIALQQDNQASPIDLAESFHLQGVFLLSQKKPQDAEKSLQAALVLWNTVRETTGEHPIRFVTMQSLANVQMNLNKTTEAIELLKITYDNQVSYFGTEKQLDVGKTLHFLGEAYEKAKNYKEAANAYQQSLQVKKEISASADIIKPTQEALTRLQPLMTAAQSQEDKNDKPKPHKAWTPQALKYGTKAIVAGVGLCVGLCLLRRLTNTSAAPNANVDMTKGLTK